ncbi:cell division protein FtsZ [bacterium]|uniref:cell division protein FtsZ n=1 Tax=Gemmiger sp. TaxID=2049027 RepID=UPI002A82FD32|nr:cell division protein FtsZ [Gemmiger sp.]MCI5557220.1 cell division protein FtsZ [bacterium]MCI6083299.1 cell division protein FtsZ [bacterium]MCI6520983.1 cell division protein FtsZ [bacterium]MCI7193380.1 cell division protein FtsZ [bacterium]MDD6718806.1 cell division protein FtsZ [bacterium]
MAFVLDEEMQNVTNIKVIGVGGGGGNAVNRMVEAGLNGVEFVAMNTDQQALVNSKATQKVQLGAKLTKGRGAGADPEVGQRAAEESKDEIANALKGAQMVFITAGMGGGTGTGAAPVVAETAHDLGILTVGIVTKPFAFEGKRKMSIAEQGIANLMMHVDSLIVIPNERLKLISQEKITLMNAFEAADNVLRQGVESISSLINVPAFINLDFADVRSIMKDAGFAHMGVGVAKGAGKAENAAKAAISSPLLETSIAGARGVIINITSSPDIGLDDVETAASMITQSAHPDANIIWGTAFDERLQDEMSITVVATGFESTPGVDEPIQAAMDAQKAAAAAAAPAAPKAEAPKAKPAVDPVIPNPVFSNVFNPNVDTPVSTTPVSQPEPAEEDDGDYFNDLLSILNKRS